MLRPVSKLPPRSRPSAQESAYASDLREFMRSRQEVAILEMPGKTARQVVQSVRGMLTRRPDLYPGIGVAQRGGKVYLYKVEKEGVVK